MGSAILGGILKAGTFLPEDVILCDLDEKKCAPFLEKGCAFTSSPIDAAARGDCILLAIKPQQMTDTLRDLAACCAGKLVISIAAGVTLSSLCRMIPAASLIRVMPNTPLLVGEGVSAVCRAQGVTEEDYQLALKIFSASGKAYEIPESLMNAVTALTSSSVAYFARFAGEMCEWGRKNGFSDDAQILDMVARTMSGTAGLLLNTEHTPKSLERAVTSPNGTTERAMAVFTEQDLSSTVQNAMDACLARADELSESN